MVLKLLKSVSLRGLLLALFLMPSFTYASDVWQASGTPKGYSSDALTACYAVASQCIYYPDVNVSLYPTSTNPSHCSINARANSSYGCSNSLSLKDLNCSVVGEGYTDDGTGQCVPPPPPPTCSESQVEVAGGQCEDKCPTTQTDGSSIKRNFVVAYNSIPNTMTDDSLGCGFGTPNITGCFFSGGDTDIQCFVEYTQDGSYAGVDASTGTIYAGSTEPNSLTYVAPPSSSTDVSTPDTVTNADGSVTSSENVTIAQTGETSKTITNSDTGVQVNTSTGSTNVQQKAVVTTSQSDGSYSVADNTTNTYTPPSYETDVQPADNSTPTNSSNASPSITTTQTTNTYYNSSGGVISSTSSGSSSTGNGTGTGTATDESGEKLYEVVIGQGSLTEGLTQVQTDIVSAKAELLAQFDTIKSEANSLVNFSEGGSGSLPCPPPVDIIGFGTFEICMTDYAEQLSIVKVVLLMVGSFLALSIVLR
jgi:hypothetical protein